MEGFPGLREKGEYEEIGEEECLALKLAQVMRTSSTKETRMKRMTFGRGLVAPVKTSAIDARMVMIVRRGSRNEQSGVLHQDGGAGVYPSPPLISRMARNIGVVEVRMADQINLVQPSCDFSV